MKWKKNNILKKLKVWLLAEEDIDEPKFVSKKIFKRNIIKSQMYNFMYVDEMKIKIGYITNVFP